tara:strand:+ start:6209 stop:6487 length:279 start_codon:yes stop_codon:yes gene_type:complete
MKEEDFLDLKTHLQMEIQGFVLVKYEEYEKYENIYEVLLREKYIEIIEENSDLDNKDLEYRITVKGKPYFKHYDNYLWIKPHAVHFVESLLE